MNTDVKDEEIAWSLSYSAIEATEDIGAIAVRQEGEIVSMLDTMAVEREIHRLHGVIRDVRARLWGILSSDYSLSEYREKEKVWAAETERLLVVPKQIRAAACEKRPEV